MLPFQSAVMIYFSLPSKLFEEFRNGWVVDICTSKQMIRQGWQTFIQGMASAVCRTVVVTVIKLKITKSCLLKRYDMDNQE